METYFPQTITFQGIPIIGMDGFLRRGTKAGKFRIRVPHDANLTASTGDLVFQSDSGSVTLARCVPDLSTIRSENRNGRREYSLIVQDRRATWAGPTITRKCNRRYWDNTIEGDTKQTAGEMVARCLGLLDEDDGAADIGAVYPPGDWSQKPVAHAIDDTLRWIPAHICRSSDDKYACYKTGVGDEINTSWPTKLPDYIADLDAGPETLRVVCGKTWFGCGLTLEAVGLETDDTYKPIDTLSYTPPNGWRNEWPTLLAGVSPGIRSTRALPTVFRCYRVVVPQSLPFEDADGNTLYISKYDDIDINWHRFTQGEVEPPTCYVGGTFWPMGDHPYNVDNCPHVDCDFTLDNELKLVRFEYPIWKMANCIAPAELTLYCSFHLRGTDGGWIKEAYTKERESGSGEWTLDVPWLWRARARGYVDCDMTGERDNSDSLDTEANELLDLWAAHFDAIRNKRIARPAGIHPASLSGKIAHVGYRLGRGLSPQTTVTEHFEPSTEG